MPPDPEPEARTDVPPHVWALVVRDVEMMASAEPNADEPADALVARYRELLAAIGYLRARIHERDGR